MTRTMRLSFAVDMIKVAVVSTLILSSCNALLFPVDIPYISQPAVISSSLLSTQVDLRPASNLPRDKVVRVLDGTTIKLEKAGVVKLAGISSTDASQRSECVTKSPSFKIRQVLPPKTDVKYSIVEQKDKPKVLLYRENDLVQKTLVESGFARVPSSSILFERLAPLASKARDEYKGMYAVCDKEPEQAVFEPIEVTTQTIYDDDGGRTVIVKQESNGEELPKNPGDIRGCSDFAVYEDALSYYERFYPYYGDVAKLDRDGDGVPCPKLPHTKNPDRYRMKAPKK